MARRYLTGGPVIAKRDLITSQNRANYRRRADGTDMTVKTARNIHSYAFISIWGRRRRFNGSNLSF